MTRLALMSLLASLVICTNAPADEWPRFRGPNGSGVAGSTSALIPAKWDERDVAWKIEVPGQGHSSPVIFGNKLFLTSADRAVGKRYLLCIDARTGDTLWTREFDFSPYAQHRDNAYAAATPAVDSTHVYLPWINPQRYELFAFDHDGNEVWKADLGPFRSQHMNGSSPILVEDLVVLFNDQEGPGESGVLAFDRTTGKQRWKLPRKSDKSTTGTPCIYQPKDGPPQVIVASNAHGLTSIDARTGKILWEVPDALPFRVVSSPVVSGDVIVATSGEGARNRSMIAIKANGLEKPAVLFRHTGYTPYVPSVVAKGNLLFAWNDVGQVTCLDLLTGEKHWQQNVGAQFYGSPVAVGDRLYCISKNGDVICIAAKDKFELLGRTLLGEQSHATPALAGGRMYLRTVSHLRCVGGTKVAGD
jgi:outer membrane protein assembly factor BamB